MDQESGASGTDEQPAGASSSMGVGNAGELPLSAPVAQYGVFIKNVPLDVDEEALKALFKPYGQVQRLMVVSRPESPTHLLGYVLMDTDDGTKRAIQQLDGVWFGQTRLKVEPTFGKTTHIFGVAEGSNYIRNRVAAQEERRGRQNFRDRPQNSDRWRGGFGDRHRQGDRGGHHNFQYSGRQNFLSGDGRFSDGRFSEGRFGEGRFSDHRGNRGHRCNRGGHGDGPWRQQGDHRGEGRLQDQLEQETAPRLRYAWNRQLEREPLWPSFEQLLESLADVYYDQMPPRDLRFADPPPEDARPRSLWIAGNGSPEDHVPGPGHDAWAEIFVLHQGSPSAEIADGSQTAALDAQRGSERSPSAQSGERALGTEGLTAQGFVSCSGTPKPGEALGYPALRCRRVDTEEEVTEQAPSRRGDNQSRVPGQPEPPGESFGAEAKSCEVRVDYEEGTRSAQTGAVYEPALPEAHLHGDSCRDEPLRDEDTSLTKEGRAHYGSGVKAENDVTAPKVAIGSDDTVLNKTEGTGEAAEEDDVSLVGTTAAAHNRAGAPQKVGEPRVGSGPSKDSEPVSDTVAEAVEPEAGNGGGYEPSRNQTASSDSTNPLAVVSEQSNETLNEETSAEVD